MNPLITLGWTLIVLGFVLLLLGLAGKVPWLGRLPGDIVIERDGVRIYIPIMTSLLLSVLLTLVVWLMQWWYGRR
jgi:uncharacterized membrane-anchored protein